jgi:hypothetical protein
MEQCNEFASCWGKQIDALIGHSAIPQAYRVEMSRIYNECLGKQFSKNYIASEQDSNSSQPVKINRPE